MACRTSIYTETNLPDGRNGDRIVTQSSTWSDGDSPLESEVAGHTAGMVAQGNAIAHGRYLSNRGRTEFHRNYMAD